MNIELEPTPKTGLNIRFHTIYAPRVPTPPFVGYDVRQITYDTYAITAYDDAGRGIVVFEGDLSETFVRIVQHLRLDS